MSSANKCGFNIQKDCTAVCKHYRTCTRNPDYEKLRESRKYGRRKVDKDNNGRI